MKHTTEIFQCLVALEIPDTTVINLSLVLAARSLSFATKLSYASSVTHQAPDAYVKLKHIRCHGLQMAVKDPQAESKTKGFST
jgi:hypothetical protein